MQTLIGLCQAKPAFDANMIPRVSQLSGQINTFDPRPNFYYIVVKFSKESTVVSLVNLKTTLHDPEELAKLPGSPDSC